MTARELIEKLKCVNPDAEVVVVGNEDYSFPCNLTIGTPEKINTEYYFRADPPYAKSYLGDREDGAPIYEYEDNEPKIVISDIPARG